MWSFPNGVTAPMRSPADADSGTQPRAANIRELTSRREELDRSLAEEERRLAALAARVEGLGQHPLQVTQRIKADALARLVGQIEDCAERFEQAANQSREEAIARLAERQRLQRELRRGLEALAQEMSELDRQGYH